MIILLSPSKTINPHQPPNGHKQTTPQFLAQSERLVKRVNKLGRNLGKTLGVSTAIAELNRQRFADWQAYPSEDISYSAGWMYRGETYAGLGIETLDQPTLDYLQGHAYIVSGLYGILRPQDQAMPYRLEMSTRLKINSHKNLYSFWGNTLASQIIAQQPSFILNCASNEYAKAVLPHIPPTITVITPTFLHAGRSKMAFAKFMRGTMARWAAEQHLEYPDDVRKFQSEGFTYDSDQSTHDKPVFNAPEQFTLKGRITKK